MDTANKNSPAEHSPDETDLGKNTSADMVKSLEAPTTEGSVIQPVGAHMRTAPSKGRMADKLAAIIAGTALALSCLLSALFFIGFVANDYHIFAITSALGLSLFLGGFAIVPMAIIMVLARRAYRYGGDTPLYLWVLLLILPWLALSTLGLTHTPLPIWMSGVAVLFAVFLTFWGVVSLGLNLKDRRR